MWRGWNEIAFLAGYFELASVLLWVLFFAHCLMLVKNPVNCRQDILNGSRYRVDTICETDDPGKNKMSPTREVGRHNKGLKSKMLYLHKLMIIITSCFSIMIH